MKNPHIFYFQWWRSFFFFFLSSRNKVPNTHLFRRRKKAGFKIWFFQIWLQCPKKTRSWKLMYFCFLLSSARKADLRLPASYWLKDTKKLKKINRKIIFFYWQFDNTKYMWSIQFLLLLALSNFCVVLSALDCYK